MLANLQLRQQVSTSSSFAPPDEARPDRKLSRSPQIHPVALLHGRAPSARQAVDHLDGLRVGFRGWFVRLQGDW